MSETSETTSHPETFRATNGSLVDHLDEHQTCDCPCERCTLPAVADRSIPVCICPDCNAGLCGMHPEAAS